MIGPETVAVMVRVPMSLSRIATVAATVGLLVVAFGIPLDPAMSDLSKSK